MKGWWCGDCEDFVFTKKRIVDIIGFIPIRGRVCSICGKRVNWKKIPPENDLMTNITIFPKEEKRRIYLKTFPYFCENCGSNDSLRKVTKEDYLKYTKEE